MTKTKKPSKKQRMRNKRLAAPEHMSGSSCAVYKKKKGGGGYYRLANKNLSGAQSAEKSACKSSTGKRRRLINESRFKRKT
jgi:hypothetical protein